VRNIHWALSHQRPNGWFGNCCLTDPNQPLTHTLGYTLRGIVEGYQVTRSADLLAAARLTANSLTRAIAPDGFLAGRLRSDWTPAVKWSCLTGSVQIAHSLLILHQHTGDGSYLAAARAANGYVRRTMRFDRARDTFGGIKGSFPVNGGYGTFEFLNWGAKFMIDANRAELAVKT
jgi:hypothetical protein